MKLLTVRRGGEVLVLRARAPASPTDKPAPPSPLARRGLFTGSWFHLLMLWRWRRVPCVDCDRFGGHCHAPHWVWVWRE